MVTTRYSGEHQPPPPPGLAMLPAIIAFPVLRCNLGRGVVNPVLLFLSSLLMLVGVPHLINGLVYWQGFDALNTPALCILAAIVFALGLRQWLLRRRELDAGICEIHSGETGKSVLRLLFPFIPQMLAGCVLDPLLCALTGYIVSFVSPCLGISIAICGIGVLIVEVRSYMDDRRRYIETVDGILSAQRHAERASAARRGHEPKRQRESAATPAGAGADVYELHRSRRPGE